MHTINLSGKTLTDPESLRFLEQISQDTEVDPSQVCFEVTETVAIANLSTARSFIQTMKQWGYKFALDDFGSGVLGFVYLKELPINFIKIDGGFVQDIATDATAYTIVEAIQKISRVMGLKTIAERVETDAMFECLQQIGIDYFQGRKVGLGEVWK